MRRMRTSVPTPWNSADFHFTMLADHIVKPPLSPDIMRDRQNLLAPDISGHSTPTSSSSGAP
jgi:hypothetical protein